MGVVGEIHDERRTLYDERENATDDRRPTTVTTTDNRSQTTDSTNDERFTTNERTQRTMGEAVDDGEYWSVPKVRPFKRSRRT
jgi:hypothetical protein